MSKDNYSCIFPKPKVVYCLYQPSNISSHSESSDAKTKHEAKHVDFLVLSGTAFSTIFLICKVTSVFSRPPTPPPLPIPPPLPPSPLTACRAGVSGSYGKVFAALQVSRVAVISLAVLGFALKTRASPEFCVRGSNLWVIRDIHRFIFFIHDSVDFATSNYRKLN